MSSRARWLTPAVFTLLGTIPVFAGIVVVGLRYDARVSRDARGALE